MPLPTKCLGWAVEQLLDVRLCAAIAPSPEGSDKSLSQPTRKRTSCFPDYAQHDCNTQAPPVECLGWAVELLLDVLSCAAIAPSPEGSDESQSQSAHASVRVASLINPSKTATQRLHCHCSLTWEENGS